MLTTGRILRAFAWLRWRLLMNSFEKHGSRDAMERLSIAFEQLIPILGLLLMAPTALVLAGAASYSGYLLAHEELRIVPLEILRFVLLAGCVFAVIAPIALPAGDRTGTARLLLLPIPRGLLYFSHAASTLVDPWMMLSVAIVLAMPIGLIAGGAPDAGAVALLAGGVLLSVLAGLTALVTALVQLAFRDRRRGELLALVLILVLPTLGVLPALVQSRGARLADRPIDRAPAPTASAGLGRTLFALVPSETYVRTVRAAARRDGAARSLLTLVALSVALHGFASVVYARLLASPATSGHGVSQARWGVRLPGVGPATSAVALAQLRLGLRTPRGRSTILSPVVLLLVFIAVMSRSGAAPLGFIATQGGLALAAFTSFVSLLAIVPLAMNQFAVDGAGLTLTLLTPVGTRQLLYGKAIGNALIAAIPAAVCWLGSLAVASGGHPAVWLCIPLAFVACYVLVAPAAAALSAIFPKAVNMNTISGRSNAHGAAGLLGTAAYAIAAAACWLIVLTATVFIGRPALAPVLLVMWTAVCVGIAVALFRAVAVLFERRRENLALVV